MGVEWEKQMGRKFSSSGRGVSRLIANIAISSLPYQYREFW